MENLTSYQAWQMEKYGNITPENGMPFSEQKSTDEIYFDRCSDLLPENLISKH